LRRFWRRFGRSRIQIAGAGKKRKKKQEIEN